MNGTPLGWIRDGLLPPARSRTANGTPLGRVRDGLLPSARSRAANGTPLGRIRDCSGCCDRRTANGTRSTLFLWRHACLPLPRCTADGTRFGVGASWRRTAYGARLCLRLGSRGLLRRRSRWARHCGMDAGEESWGAGAPSGSCENGCGRARVRMPMDKIIRHRGTRHRGRNRDVRTPRMDGHIPMHNLSYASRIHLRLTQLFSVGNTMFM